MLKKVIVYMKWYNLINCNPMKIYLIFQAVPELSCISNYFFSSLSGILDKYESVLLIFISSQIYNRYFAFWKIWIHKNSVFKISFLNSPNLFLKFSITFTRPLIFARGASRSLRKIYSALQSCTENCTEGSLSISTGIFLRN